MDTETHRERLNGHCRSLRFGNIGREEEEPAINERKKKKKKKKWRRIVGTSMDSPAGIVAIVAGIFRIQSFNFIVRYHLRFSEILSD